MITAGIDFLEQGEGPAIICLHGIGGSAESFRHQLDGLRGHRVIAWNMPGYGKSTARPLTFAGLSEALAEFIDALDLTCAHLLGHSIGGMIAIDHALRRPDQVQSLALIGTTSSFGGRDDSFKQAFLKARLAPLDAGMSMTDMAKQAAPRLVGPIADQPCIAAVQSQLALVSETTWRNVLQCLVTFDRRDDFGDITQPCCLIAGAEDQNAPSQTMKKMAAKLSNTAFHEIAGVGHMINQEAPDQVNAILQAFYQEQSP